MSSADCGSSAGAGRRCRRTAIAAGRLGRRCRMIRQAPGIGDTAAPTSQQQRERAACAHGRTAAPGGKPGRSSRLTSLAPSARLPSVPAGIRPLDPSPRPAMRSRFERRPAKPLRSGDHPILPERRTSPSRTKSPWTPPSSRTTPRNGQSRGAVVHADRHAEIALQVGGDPRQRARHRKLPLRSTDIDG